MNPPRPRPVPLLGLTYRAKGPERPPFEPLQSTSLRALSLKTALQLALTVLKPRLGYVPKVLSTPFRTKVISLSALPPLTGSQELSLLCPVRALRVYIERSVSYRKSEQLFVSFGNCTNGGPVTKQGISRWLVDAIILAYSSLGLQCPIGVRAHSTRGIHLPQLHL